MHITSPHAFPSLQAQFPPPDLAERLVALYFTHFNDMYPLLHRPTFTRQFFDERLYERDIWYACLCMAVFAPGSRFSDDVRVLADDLPPHAPGGGAARAAAAVAASEGVERDGKRWQRAGWKYHFVSIGMSLLVGVLISALDGCSPSCPDIVLRKRSMLTPACLFEVQTLCVSTLPMPRRLFHRLFLISFSGILSPAF